MTDSDTFDWDDYHRDTRELSLAAKGAWWDCLYKMRLSRTRGQISMPLSSYARMFGCSSEEAKTVIGEISELRIGDAVTEHNGNVTLTNRRMYRIHLEKEANKQRQSRHRQKIARGENSESNGNVTNCQQSPSVVEEFKKEEIKQKKQRPLVTSSRIPEPFPLTVEMTEWAQKNCSGLRLTEAHENFVEYYTNLTTAKAFKVDWGLTWKKGMKLALKWQTGDLYKSSVGGHNSTLEIPIEDPLCSCGREYCTGGHRSAEVAA